VLPPVRLCLFGSPSNTAFHTSSRVQSTPRFGARPPKAVAEVARVPLLDTAPKFVADLWQNRRQNVTSSPPPEQIEIGEHL
jgi:hypothetical protein